MNRVHAALRPRWRPMLLVSLLAQGIAPGTGPGPEASPTEGGLEHPVKAEVARASRYHLRFLRARWDAGWPGSALFAPNEIVVPLAEREPWGRPGQIESLREALGASDVETIPGLVVDGGPADVGEPHWFRTALGPSLVEISFLGEELTDGWHRVALSAWGERGVELLDAGLLVRGGATVALVAPFGADDEALIIGVTPLGLAVESVAGGIRRAGFDGVDYPVLIEDTKAMPVYPEEAREQQLTGNVIMEIVVRADGVPDGIRVLRMPEGGERLAGVAVEAVSQWRYQPATLDGVPVNTYFTVVFEFILK